MAKKKQQGVSVLVVTVAVFAVVTCMGWGMLAGSYAGATGTTPEIMESDDDPENLNLDRSRRARRSAVVSSFLEAIITFVGNAFAQLPNIPTVFSWHFSNRIWLPILIVILQLGVIAGGFGMQQLEQSLWEKPKVKRRKMATPKVVDTD